MSIRLIDASEFVRREEESYEAPSRYRVEESVLGKVFIPIEGVIITGKICVRYERHPWIETFEIDGIKAAPPIRRGPGTKDYQEFVTSLATIYPKAYDDYREMGHDVHEYFGRITEYYLDIYLHSLEAAESASTNDDDSTNDGLCKINPQKMLFRKFTGLVENMWREGNEEMLDVAMRTILPMICKNDISKEAFQYSISEDFHEYIAAEES